MRRLFAVMRTRGMAWNSAIPMEDQPDWRLHAEFMDDLYAESFLVLVGPLEGTSDVLLIARANDVEEVRARLATDPWIKNGLLREISAAPWTLRLGALG